MSYLIAAPSPLQRSGLLGVVIALHAGLLIAIFAARAVAPHVAALPLVVDLLPAPAAETAPAAQPLPVAAQPVPQKQKSAPTPKLRTPPVESTTSPVAAENAVASAALNEPKAAPTSPGVASESLSQARFDADYLRNPAPPYPPLARRMGESGRVILRVSVNPQGTADSVEIKTSSGSPRLDEAAQKTVRSWKFIPAKRGETAVQSSVLVPIIFTLEH